jgi:hypothetical protein
MCSKLFVAILMIAFNVGAQSPINSRTNSCSARSDLVGKCFMVHGRLSVYNGTPSVRLWRLGSKRLLGVFDPKDPSGELGEAAIPATVKAKLDWDKFVFGDFLVCPLTRSQPGRMQTICIESAKNLVVRQRNEGERP